MSEVNELVATLNEFINVPHLILREEKTKYVLQGHNLCTIYPKVKHVKLSLDEEKLVIKIESTHVTDNTKSKFKQLMLLLDEFNELKEHNAIHKIITTMSPTLKTISNIKTFKTHETKIKKDVLVVHDKYYTKVGSLFYNKNSGNFVSHCDPIRLKFLGGLIWDKNNTFRDVIKVDDNTLIINSNDDNKKTKTKDKQFISVNELLTLLNKNKNMLVGKRVILYDLNNSCMEQIINIIFDDNIDKPYGYPMNVWITLGQKVFVPHILNIVTLLCWNKNISTHDMSNKIPLFMFGHNICNTLKHNKIIKHNKNIIEINRIRYEMSAFDEKIFDAIWVEGGDSETIMFIDKLLFRKHAMPSVIFESKCCVVCKDKFNDKNKTYLSCGHTLCIECASITLWNKQNCPTCRKKLGCKSICVNAAVSHTSGKNVKLCETLRLIIGEATHNNILIYVDSTDMIKYFMNEIRTQLIYNKFNITNDTSNLTKNLTKTIIFSLNKHQQSISETKNITHVMTLTTTYDYITNAKLLGYDYYVNKLPIKIFIFELEEK
jgi:hypothetical protein